MPPKRPQHPLPPNAKGEEQSASDRRRRARKSEAASPTTQVEITNSVFPAELKGLLSFTEENGKKTRNTELRERIRDRLRISDTTLYVWQNPKKGPKGRAQMLPSAEQTVQLAMAIADCSPGVNRTEIINRWLALAGYDPKHVAKGDSAFGETTADELTRMFEDSARVISTTILSAAVGQAENARIMAACYFSQLVTVGLVNQWCAKAEGGHVLIFWRWNNANLLRRFKGESMKAMAGLFRKILVSEKDERIPTGAFISIFVLIDGRPLDKIEQQQLRLHLKPIHTEFPASIQLFTECYSAEIRPQHLGDVWIFDGPSLRLPFLFTDYDRIFQYLLTIPEIQLHNLAPEFNPFVWSSYSAILDESTISRFLSDRRILPPSPKTPVEFLSTESWAEIDFSQTNRTT